MQAVVRRFPLRSAAVFVCLFVTTSAPAQQQQQQRGGMQPGEAFVTRFSGVTTVPGAGQGGHANFIIDPRGTVGSIIDLRAPRQPPQGQHWINELQRQPVTAGDVGQVFGVALDDATPPNIYLTATAAFGLHRTPDNRDWMAGMWGQAGPGGIYRLDAASGYRPQPFTTLALGGRQNTGAALGNIAYDRVNKQFFVSDLETGMIHRIGPDGRDRGLYDHGTQGRTNFTDAASKQRASMPPIPFDPSSRARISDCPTQAFDNSPECWNVAASNRRVWGLGVAQFGPADVRLFYSVTSSPAFGNTTWNNLSDEEKRNTVWSIRIAPGGDFDLNDIRREFFLPDFFLDVQDVGRAGYSHPVSDIAFPSCSTKPIMLVSERGGLRNLGLAADNPFADPHEARSIRYELDGSGVWQPIGRYDIGFYDRQKEGPPYIRANCAGGAAFGPGYREGEWRADPSRADQWVWITGDSLCSPDGPCNLPGGPGAQAAPQAPPMQAPGRPPVQPTAQQQAQQEPQGDDSEVHGVQGLKESAFDELVPALANDANAQQPPPPVGPSQAWLIDTDINVDASGAPIQEELTRNDATLIGDIAIYQPCAGDALAYFVPPPPMQAFAGWTAIHPAELSHARYASHGRALSHFRFGSHSLEFSHNRWESHWPYLSHGRERSHYTWFSINHFRPLSPGHNRSLSPTHFRPFSPGHRRWLSPNHRRPLSPTHNRFISPGHLRPLSPTHTRAFSPGHRLPLSPGHLRALSPGGHRLPLSPGGVHLARLSAGGHPAALSHTRAMSVGGAGSGIVHNATLSRGPIHNRAASRRGAGGADSHRAALSRGPIDTHKRAVSRRAETPKRIERPKIERKRIERPRIERPRIERRRVEPRRMGGGGGGGPRVGGGGGGPGRIGGGGGVPRFGGGGGGGRRTGGGGGGGGGGGKRRF